MIVVILDPSSPTPVLRDEQFGPYSWDPCLFAHAQGVACRDRLAGRRPASLSVNEVAGLVFMYGKINIGM